jgi:4-diphosphocytidyl-2C-methyl-D-erythritol kinase
MTGSGSAVFGVYGDIENAKRAYEQLKNVYRACFLAETVN